MDPDIAIVLKATQISAIRYSILTSIHIGSIMPFEYSSYIT